MNNLENLNLVELNKTELQDIEGGRRKWWQLLLIG